MKCRCLECQSVQRKSSDSRRHKQTCSLSLCVTLYSNLKLKIWYFAIKKNSLWLCVYIYCPVHINTAVSVPVTAAQRVLCMGDWGFHKFSKSSHTNRELATTNQLGHFHLPKKTTLTAFFFLQISKKQDTNMKSSAEQVVSFHPHPAFSHWVNEM